MPDKVKILYDAVSKDYNVGSFEDFQTKLQDDTKRKAFYDAVSSEFELGDFNTFSSKVKKKDIFQVGSADGSKPLLSGSKPFQAQVDTKIPSVLTEKGKVVYGEEIKKKAQQKQKLSEQLKAAESAFALAQGEDVVRDIEMYQQDPESFRQVDAGSWLGNAIKQGLLTGELANSLPVGGVPSTPEDLSKIADINYQIERIPQSEAQKEYQKSGLGVFKNPLLGAQFLTETLASSFAGLYESAKRTVPLATSTGAGVGAFAGGVGALPGAGLGAMAGLSVAGLNLSTSADIMQSLKDSGVDITDKDSLIKAFSDKNKMSEIRTNALKYGVPIMVIDMAAAGIAGKLIRGAAGKSIAKKIGAGLGEAGIQAVGGSTGELSGQYLSGKKINWNEVAMEGIASLATDAPDIAIGALTRDKASSSNKNIISQINKFGAEDGALDAKINLDRDLANGTITQDEYQQGVQFIEKAILANEKIPIGIEGENREKSIELISKKDDILLDIEDLNKQKEGVDDSFYPAIDEQIKAKEEEVKSINETIQQLAKTPSKPIEEIELDVEVPKEDLLIKPENSSNYANMTEDDKGNFIFFHVGGKGYDKIKVGTGASAVTSREEASALSKVGGMAMYYTDPNQLEKQSATGAKYVVKVPKEKVYDFNTDKLNLIEEAEARHEAENPGKAFDLNSQLAYVTKIAGEKGFDMVVAQWNDMTRAQTTKELNPIDVEESDGNIVTKKFNEEYISNKQKGFVPVIPVTKFEKLKNIYDKINIIRNNEQRYDDIYRLYSDYNKYSQDEITQLINDSDLPQEIKDEYNNIIQSKQDTRRSEQTKKQEDAIQKQTTGQVPVQPEARVGEKVEEGKPEPEAEVVTEEGKTKEESLKERLSGKKIRVFRGIEEGDPRDTISQGEYITFSKDNARYYAGENGKVIEAFVDIDDITEADNGDYFFNPEKEESIINYNKQFPEYRRTLPVLSAYIKGDDLNLVKSINEALGETSKVQEEVTPKSKTKAEPKVITEEGKEKVVVIDKPSIIKNSANELNRVKSVDIKSEDGATFNIDGTKYEGSGLVVPVASINTTVDKITPKMLADFVEKNKNKIGDKDTVKFGIYKFPNSNQISIDLNIIAPEKFRAEAIKFGKMAGQESLFDLSTYENIKTGSDGKNPINFTDEQFKEISKSLKVGKLPNVFGLKGKDVVSEVKLNENNLETAIELLDDIENNRKKASRASSKRKAEIEKKIADDEAELASISNEAKIIKSINDNFDNIKKELKDKGLLKVNCK